MIALILLPDNRISCLAAGFLGNVRNCLTNALCECLGSRLPPIDRAATAFASLDFHGG